MLGIIATGLFLVVLAGHTIGAAIMTRFFRLRLETQLGWVVYSLGVIPVVLLVSTLFFTGVLQLGPNLGSPAVAVAVTVGLPLALGLTIDLLYVAQPDEVELPDTQ